MKELLIGVSGMIALFSGWSVLWQIIFGEFDGIWGRKENRGNLAAVFVVSTVILMVLVE